MPKLAIQIIAGLVGLLVLAGVVMWVVGFGPFASPTKAIIKEQRKDAAASTKIETKGAEAVAKDVATATAVQDQAKAQVEYVTRTVRLSPTASTPIPADRLARLRNADSELCKLGVGCVSAGSGAQSGGPASAPDASIR